MRTPGGSIGDAEALVLGGDPAGAEADLHAAVGEQVEGGQLLGQHDRLVEVDVEDAAADAQRGGRRRGGGHRGDRGHVDRPVARGLGDRARAEVVVGREQRAVAEVLGAAGGLDPLLAGRGLEGLDGEAERALCGSHGIPRSRPARFRRRPYSTTIPVTALADGVAPTRQMDDEAIRRWTIDDSRTPGSRTTTSSPTSTCAGSAPTRRPPGDVPPDATLGVHSHPCDTLYVIQSGSSSSRARARTARRAALGAGRGRVRAGARRPDGAWC